MKNTILTLGVLFIAYLGFGQMSNNQTGNSERSLDEFDKITVEDGIHVILEFGNEESIRIESGGISADEVLTNVNWFNRLKVELRGDQYYEDVKVYVTYKNLKEVKAFSGSSVESRQAISMHDEFEIAADDRSRIRLDLKADEVGIQAEGNAMVDLNVQASEVEVDVNSSARVSLSGRGDYLEVNAKNSGIFEGFDFRSKEADLNAADGSDVQAMVMEDLEAKATNGASVTYKGNPRNTKSEPSGGGTVEPAR